MPTNYRKPLLLWLGLLLGVLWAAPALAQDSTEEAESSAGGEEDEEATTVTEASPESKTLAERIPSVTRRVFKKQGRVELFPAVGWSLNDPFYNHVVATGGLSFHVLESLSIGVTGEYYAALQAKVPVTGGRLAGDPSVNSPAYAARLEAAWSPLYGKLSILAEGVVHFDVYALAGAGVVGGSDSKPTVAGVVGLGQHYFLNDWMALRIEVRDQIFVMSRDGAAPGQDKHIQSLLSASLGMCFYLPSQFEREAL